MARALQSSRRMVAGELERIFEEGVASLSERELVHALVGGGARGELLADALLEGGLPGLRLLREQQLPAAEPQRGKAARVLAAVELGRRVLSAAPVVPRPRLLTAAALLARLWPRLAHLRHEEFWALLLTPRMEELRLVRISLGGLSQCSVLPREAFAPAMLHNASAVVFAHNHPSGDETPSAEDMRLQLLLGEAGNALAINVVDHFVLGSAAAHSAKSGRMPAPAEYALRPIARP